MTKYLLDTNVVLRLSNPSDISHKLVTEAIATLLTQQNDCYLTAQVLIEFWVVATRPTDVNGLGWSVEQTHTVIEQLLDQFPCADETPHIFSGWLSLVNEHQVKGKRAHDVRLAALMLSSGISQILTLNPKDFSGIPGISTVQPQDIIKSRQETNDA